MPPLGAAADGSTIAVEPPPRALTARRRPTLLASQRRRAAELLVALFAVAACAMASLAIGALEIAPADVLAALTSFDDSRAHVIVTELRLPRTVVGLLVDAALGAAGALLQGITRNPLADPGILGINAGAAFAAEFALIVEKLGREPNGVRRDRHLDRRGAVLPVPAAARQPARGGGMTRGRTRRTLAMTPASRRCTR